MSVLAAKRSSSSGGYGKGAYTIPGGFETRRSSTWQDDERPGQREAAKDEYLLARLGKKQETRRNFDFVSMLGFTSATLITWEMFYIIFGNYLLAGSAKVVWSFVIIFLGSVCTFSTINELASMAPTAGGYYVWTYMLAPESCRASLSYVVGCFSVLARQLAVSAQVLALGCIIQSLAAANYPSYSPQGWHVLLMIWFFLAVALFFNTVGSIVLPVMQPGFLIIHVLGFVAVFIILAYMAPHGTAEQVFITFYDRGGWSAGGLSIPVSLGTSVYTFIGADAAVHMAEEIQNSAVNVPRVIMTSTLMNGLMGLAIVLGTMFSFTAIDLETLLNGRFPFIGIFQYATGNIGGATALAAIVIVMTFSSTVGTMAVASRVLWAFARDKATPFSAHLARTDARKHIPVRATVAVSALPFAVALVDLGSDATFQNVCFVVAVSTYLVYLVCAGLLLYRRVRGQIAEPDPPPAGAVNVPDVLSGRLAWGPWRLAGRPGLVVNAVSCAYIALVLFFSLWPTVSHPTPGEMNWTVVVVAGVALCSVTYYLVAGRRMYKGPVQEIVL